MNSNVKLSWTGFSAKIPQTLKNISDEKEFTDVTLATDDGTQILAHQIILSSGSAFFKRILMMNKNHHQRPFLFLSGLKGSLVAALVNFVYLGECSVNEEDLDEFVKTGKEFGLQGIEEVTLEDDYGEDEGGGKTEETLSPSLLETARDDILTKEYLKLEVDFETLSDDAFDINELDISEEHITESDGKNQSCDAQENPPTEAVINPFWNLGKMTGILPSEIVSDDLEENLAGESTSKAARHLLQRRNVSDEILDLEVGNLLRKNVDVSKTGSGKGKSEDENPKEKIVSVNNTNRQAKVDVQRLHLVDHNEPPVKFRKFYCNLCSYSTRRGHHLNQHKAEKHEGREYSCNICGFQAAYSSQLSRHKMDKHVNRKLECNSCDYKTTRRDNLRSHRCRPYRVNVESKSKRESYNNFEI